MESLEDSATISNNVGVNMDNRSEINDDNNDILETLNDNMEPDKSKHNNNSDGKDNAIITPQISEESNAQAEQEDGNVLDKNDDNNDDDVDDYDPLTLLKKTRRKPARILDDSDGSDQDVETNDALDKSEAILSERFQADLTDDNDDDDDDDQILHATNEDHDGNNRKLSMDLSTSELNSEWESKQKSSKAQKSSKQEKKKLKSKHEKTKISAVSSSDEESESELPTTGDQETADSPSDDDSNNLPSSSTSKVMRVSSKTNIYKINISSE